MQKKIGNFEIEAGIEWQIGFGIGINRHIFFIMFGPFHFFLDWT